MTVGESLTQARRQAGLSIGELSERTRIRDTVIRGIEHDQYEACGGDLYVRGYVRAIAGAVGIDAQPLIRKYDQVREIHPTAPAEADLAVTRFDLVPFPGGFEATRLDLPAVTDAPAPPEDLMAAGYQLPPARLTGPAAPGTRARPGHASHGGHAGHAGHGRHGGQGGTARERARTGRGRRGLLVGFAALVVLGAVGAVGIRLASSSTTSRNTAAASGPRTVTSSAATASASAAATAPAKPAKSAKRARPAKRARLARARRTPATLPVTTLPVTTLPIAAAEAFGPDGLADGDNPGIAQDAIAADAPVPWSTQWYATPEFGMLKHGTGLLLDLGRPVTITSVRLDLAEYQGADLQIQVGDHAVPGDLRVVATAGDTGGEVQLALHRPVAGRYLLIWFTVLPPNGAGQYEESVSRVLVNGRLS